MERVHGPGSKAQGIRLNAGVDFFWWSVQNPGSKSRSSSLLMASTPGPFAQVGRMGRRGAKDPHHGIVAGVVEGVLGAVCGGEEGDTPTGGLVSIEARRWKCEPHRVDVETIAAPLARI